MYKDAREELKRLEEALLEEEEPQPEEAEELEQLLERANELLQEEPSDETRVFQWQPEAIQNAHVYNTDKMDGDLDDFSETVRNGERKNLTGLILTAILLTAGIVAVLIWWLIRYKGAFL